MPSAAEAGAGTEDRASSASSASSATEARNADPGHSRKEIRVHRAMCNLSCLRHLTLLLPMTRLLLSPRSLD